MADTNIIPFPLKGNEEPRDLHERRWEGFETAVVDVLALGPGKEHVRKVLYALCQGRAGEDVTPDLTTVTTRDPSDR